MTSLIRRDCDSIGIFLNRSIDDLLCASIVAQMDDLCSLVLKDPANDVDGRVMSIEEAGSCDESGGAHGSSWTLRVGKSKESLRFLNGISSKESEGSSSRAGKELAQDVTKMSPEGAIFRIRCVPHA